MASKVTTISDLIHSLATSCLQQPLPRGHNESTDNTSSDNQTDYQEVDDDQKEDEEDSEQESEKEGNGFESMREKNKNKMGLEREREMEVLMREVFESVSTMKRAYVSLQEAHNPWDQEKMSVADVAVVAELKKLGSLREKFKRRSRGICGGGGGRGGFAPLREVVAPYEAAMAELKREVKAKEVEVENLKEKLRSAMMSTSSTSGKKGKFQSKRRVSCSLGHVAPAPELFEGTMSQVIETSKTFTSLLLTLMRSARWDISAAVRSIESATTTTTNASPANDNMTSIISPQQAKYALESYICQKIFQGFDHETFYIDGSLSSLLNPEQFRRDCFTQFRDMKSMEPAELLGILPTCHFGKFCFKKFLAIVHPKMEESLFGNLEHHNIVLAGNHPRSQFYGEFLRLAKAVWLLHLLAFALDPAPCHFQASKGAEFHAEYMESVVRYSGGRVPVGQIVGFPVSPGFKLGSGSVIKSRVYLVSRS